MNTAEYYDDTCIATVDLNTSEYITKYTYSRRLICEYMWMFAKYRSDTCISVAQQEYIGIWLKYSRNTCIPVPQREYVEIRAKSKSLGPWKYMGPLAQPRGGPWPLALWPLSRILEPLCQGLILLIRRVHHSCLLLLNQRRPHSLQASAVRSCRYSLRRDCGAYCRTYSSVFLDMYRELVF